MSAIPKEWIWRDHYKGSTFTPKKIKFNFDITGVVITCQLKPLGSTKVIYEWKTGVNITILDLLTGEIILNKINKFAPTAGNYVYDIQMDFVDLVNETYIRGTQKVIQDITVPIL